MSTDAGISCLIIANIVFIIYPQISSTDLTNGVINTAFLMLYKVSSFSSSIGAYDVKILTLSQDLVKLYTVYNDIMINLLEKFFEMKKSQCREAIEFYRRFLTRQEGVQAFLELSEVRRKFTIPLSCC